MIQARAVAWQRVARGSEHSAPTPLQPELAVFVLRVRWRVCVHELHLET